MKLVAVTAKLPLPDRRALEERARAEDRTLSWIVRRALRESLGKGAPRQRTYEPTPPAAA